jgi:hypothetical protein
MSLRARLKEYDSIRAEVQPQGPSGGCLPLEVKISSWRNGCCLAQAKPLHLGSKSAAVCTACRHMRFHQRRPAGAGTGNGQFLGPNTTPKSATPRVPLIPVPP